MYISGLEIEIFIKILYYFINLKTAYLLLLFPFKMLSHLDYWLVIFRNHY